VIYNLDADPIEVYLEFNLIEARAAAILTPHLMRHAPSVFWSHFLCGLYAGKNNCPMDKLLAQLLF